MKAAGRSYFTYVLHLATTLRSEMHCTAIVMYMLDILSCIYVGKWLQAVMDDQLPARLLCTVQALVLHAVRLSTIGQRTKNKTLCTYKM